MYVLGNGNYLFSSLDKLVFDGCFGSHVLRQLVTDRINYNKDVYIDNFLEDFSKYVEKIRENGVE